MSLNRVVDIAGSSLTAQRVRMEASAANLANAETTRTPEGGPYRRKFPIFETESKAVSRLDRNRGRVPSGVRVERIVSDPSEPALRYQPGHPDADAEGYVRYPNVNATEEMVDLMSAARSYEASLSVLRVARQLMQATLNLVR